MLAYLITEPELGTAGPLDATLDHRGEDEPQLAALAYDAAPDAADQCWLPARRRASVGLGLPLA